MTPTNVPPAEESDGRPIPIVHVLEATTGGTRTHLRQLLLGLDAGRFRQSLVCSTRRDPAFRDDLRLFRERGISVHLIPMRRSIHPVYDLLAAAGLVSALRPQRDGILHAHSAKAGFLARGVGRLLRFPLVLYTPHAFPFLMRDGHARTGLYLGLERWAARWATRIVCVSESERQAALAAGIGPPEKLLTIPNAVTLPGLSPSARAEARARLQVETDALILGSVGHFSGQKGGCYLLQAFQRVHARHPRTRLFLFGRGPLEDRLRARARSLGIEEAVVFAGQREPMEDYYPALDLFVLSSLWEGCPYSLLEAMSFALPVVATRVVGTRDIVRHGSSGLLVPACDAGALAAAVDQLLQRPALRRRLGQAARERIEQAFGRERFLERMGDLYQMLWDRR